MMNTINPAVTLLQARETASQTEKEAIYRGLKGPNPIYNILIRIRLNLPIQEAS